MNDSRVAKMAKVVKDKDRVNGKSILVCDAREPVEPTLYRVLVDSAPGKLRRWLALSMDQGKCNFQHVYFEDGAGGTDGFVDEEDDEDGEFTERVSAWLDGMLTPANEWKAPFAGEIAFGMTLAQV